MTTALLKYHKVSLIFLVSCCALYLSFAYDLAREDFIKLITLYSALFFLSWKFFKLEASNTMFLFAAAVIFRVLFLFSLPNLSQDFYRFIWDGQLLLKGINPYLTTPKEFMASGNLPFRNARELYDGMGILSAGNHTNYPPLNQLLFALSALFSGGSILGAVVLMRLQIIAADLGIFYFGRKLLKNLNLPENRIFWYLLNPFVIIELTGNLHYEAVLLFFLIWALYLLHKRRRFWSAVMFACSVSVKLIPLLFLPLLFRRLGWKKAIGYYGLVGVVNLLLFLPFLSTEFIFNYIQTTGLWFEKFEFNASVYYFIRWIGYQVEGYNILVYVGKPLAAFIFVWVVALAFLRRNRSTAGLCTTMLFSISIYYLLATTVHPWYIAVPVLLCIFTHYKFPLLWSVVVVLSYQAYSNAGNEEKMGLLALEYLLLIAYAVYEIFKSKARKKALREGEPYKKIP